MLRNPGIKENVNVFDPPGEVFHCFDADRQ